MRKIVLKVRELINIVSKILDEDSGAKPGKFQENVRKSHILESESPKRLDFPPFPDSQPKCPYWGLVGTGKMPKPLGI